MKAHAVPSLWNVCFRRKKRGTMPRKATGVANYMESARLESRA